MNLQISSAIKSGFRDFKKNWELTFLALPTIIYLFIFAYIPLYGLVLPFKDFKIKDGFFGSKWYGVENFKYLFSDMQKLFEITRNTIGLNFLFIITGTTATVILALLLHEMERNAVKVYQTIMFFPYFISWVVVSFLVLTVFDMQNGALNNLMGLFGTQPIMWFHEPKYWPFILIGVNFWKGMGYSTVIYYAALMSVDPEYYEAARLDGATRIQQAKHISIPMIMPMIIIIFIMQMGRVLYSDFGMFYYVTQNQTLLYPTTDVIDTFVYRAMRDLGDFGMASAANFYQSTLGFLLVLLSNFIVGKINSENKIF